YATFQDRVELATPLPPGTETVRPGDSLALVPRHRLNGGLVYRPWPWLGISADARYVGAQVLRGDEADRDRPLPAHWVGNVGPTRSPWCAAAWRLISLHSWSPMTAHHAVSRAASSGHSSR